MAIKLLKFLVGFFLALPLIAEAQRAEEIPYIENENFVSNTFGFCATIANFNKHYGRILSVSKQSVKNIHDNKITDTIYVFSNSKTRIEIYKAEHGEILHTAFIDINKIPLKHQIKVGDSKAEVAERLKAAITANKIQVGNMEHNLVYTLVFLKNKLVSISFEGYLD